MLSTFSVVSIHILSIRTSGILSTVENLILQIVISDFFLGSRLNSFRYDLIIATNLWFDIVLNIRADDIIT